MALGNEFSIPWSTIETLTSSNISSNTNDSTSTMPTVQSTSVPIARNKQEQTKHRTTEVALFIYNEYLKDLTATNYTRSILNELRSIVEDLNDDLNAKSFQRLKDFLLEKTSLSLYELSSSGLVGCLLQIFQSLSYQNSHLSSSDELNVVNERAKLFCSIFSPMNNLKHFVF